MLDWESKASAILMNPRYSSQEKLRFQKILEGGTAWPAHIWVATSGSTVMKWVGLSKEAILCSAESVNRHLQSDRSDQWIHVLPDFHVGGMGIWARSYLSGAPVHNFKQDVTQKWDAKLFYQYVKDVKGTLTALVPAQLLDLIQLQLEAPASLRAVVIGGGHLTHEVYGRAIELGWKVLPSYGMTECASQVATADLGSWNSRTYPFLRRLPHVQVREQAGRLAFKGDSVLSVYAYCEQDSVRYIDPKMEGWFISEDMGIFDESYLQISGRVDQMIKVGGESVDLGYLEQRLHYFRSSFEDVPDMALIAYPDERLGHVIHLAVAGSNSEPVESVVAQFHAHVLPFERIRKIHCVPFIPRSPLLKVLKENLLRLIT